MPRSFGRLAPAAVAAPVARTALSLPEAVADMPAPAIWRLGVTALALLCGTAVAFASMLLSASSAIEDDNAREFRRLGVAPLAAGGRSGGQMVASDVVEPLAAAPERARVELEARLGSGDRIEALLMRLGAVPADAMTVGQMVYDAAPRGVAAGTAIAIRLGQRAGPALRHVDRIALRAGLGTDLMIERGPTGLAARTIRISVDERPRRIRGRVGDGLYWSLRSSGVSPESAADYLKALATKLDVGADLGPDDRFDLIIAHRRAATGEEQSGPLLYAGVQRMGAAKVEMLKWTVEGRTGWYDAASLTPVATSALAWPVSARITSSFGMRRHPILGYQRMHKGMDFGAAWGTPIVASADGVVSRAGWAGGYGRQVRIAHASAITTSYSHMSRIVVDAGSMVRQGQVIGYVGSSGLSTGPHLHYETYRGGVAVNPISVRFASAATVDPGEIKRFKARLAELLATGRG